MHVVWALLQHSQLGEVFLDVLPESHVFALRRVNSKALHFVNTYAEHRVENVLHFTWDDEAGSRKPVPTSPLSYLKLVESNLGQAAFDEMVMRNAVNWDCTAFTRTTTIAETRAQVKAVNPLLRMLSRKRDGSVTGPYVPISSDTHRIVLPAAALSAWILRPINCNNHQLLSLRTFVFPRGKSEPRLGTGDDAFCDVIRDAPNIETLHIEGFKGCNFAIVMSMLPNVTSLDVSSTDITDDDLKVLADVNSGKLVSLTVSDTKVTEGGIAALLQPRKAAFTTLVAQRSRSNGPILTDGCVDRFLSRCSSSLLVLNLSLQKLTHYAFASLSTCHQLQSLELQFEKEAKVELTSLPFSDLTQLHTVNFNGCQHHAVLEELRSLAQKRHGQNLEVVSLMNSAANDDVITALVVHCPKLRYLDVEDCYQLTGASVRAAAKCARHLTFLSVSCVPCFGETALSLRREDIRAFKRARPRCTVFCLEDDDLDDSWFDESDHDDEDW